VVPGDCELNMASGQVQLDRVAALRIGPDDARPSGADERLRWLYDIVIHRAAV
jgi:hypothetical protein